VRARRRAPSCVRPGRDWQGSYARSDRALGKPLPASENWWRRCRGISSRYSTLLRARQFVTVCADADILDASYSYFAVGWEDDTQDFQWSEYQVVDSISKFAALMFRIVNEHLIDGIRCRTDSRRLIGAIVYVRQFSLGGTNPRDFVLYHARL